MKIITLAAFAALSLSIGLGLGTANAQSLSHGVQQQPTTQAK